MSCRTTLATAICLTLPSLALAESQLDRFETLSEDLNHEMAMVMVREIEGKGGDATALRAAIPDMSWDDEFRAAGSCVLDKYEDLVGSEGVDGLLTMLAEKLPAFREATVETLSDFNIQPDGITVEQSYGIAKECGTVDLTTQRMTDSGYTAALMEAFATVAGSD